MTKGDDDILEASGKRRKRRGGKCIFPVHGQLKMTPTHAAKRKGPIIKEFSKNILAFDNVPVDKSCLEYI